MNHHKLHELAKFAAGLVLGDFLALWWISANDLLPLQFLGISITNDIVVPGLTFDASLFIILVHYGWHIGKTPTLRSRTYLMAAGVLFAVIALAHLFRIFFGVDLVIGMWVAPFWLSWVATAVTTYLSYMSFRMAMKLNK